jgi:amino acid efflux transporter
VQADVESAFLATSGAAVLKYVVGSMAGIKLLKKDSKSNRFLPWLSLVVSLVILPFIGLSLAFSAAVAALGFVYGHVVVRNRAKPSVR